MASSKWMDEGVPTWYVDHVANAASFTKYLIKDGMVQCDLPYWPPAAFKREEVGISPSKLPTDWRARLSAISRCKHPENQGLLSTVASRFDGWWKVQRRKTPLDVDVLLWAGAIRSEKDPQLKLLCLFLLQFGWPPGSQIAHLRWRNLEYDSSGRPFAIVASGVDEDFKTDADIRVWLPPNVVEALEAWKKVAPDVSQEKSILLWRQRRNGRLIETAHTARSIRMRTEAFARKWRLPRLTPVAFRHWVASALRRAGLSVPASAYWMGHDPTLSGAMRDVYDNPEDCFTEESAKLPNGPMALLEPADVSVSDGLPREIVAIIRQYQAGTIGTIELANRMESLRLKTDVSILTK